MILQNEFNDFIEKIALGKKQIDRINSAVEGIEEYLGEYYGLTGAELFIQGSYANDTAVKPRPEALNGEYDVDIVCVSASSKDNPTEALTNLELVLAANGNYKARIKRKKPCIRLEYAEDDIGKFHVDIVPARKSSTAPLEVPRRGEDWHDSAPQEYTAWCASLEEPFARTVMVLKRWRDEQQSRYAIKSIILQVLVGMNLSDADSDAERVAQTLSNIKAALAHHPFSPPSILNPALPSENLASRWEDSSYRDFLKKLEEAENIATLAVRSKNDSKASKLWHKLLGSDFMILEDTPDLAVEDYSHAKTFIDQGWSLALDPDYAISLSAEVYDRRKRPVQHYYDGRPLRPGYSLKYTANISSPHPIDIQWQVVNTGGHATREGGLRGDYFTAKTLDGERSASPAVNWESTLYTGSHWIEAFALIGNKVVARSGKLIVSVDNPNHLWYRKRYDKRQ